MAWLGEKRKTEFSWIEASQAMSESRIFEQEYHFLLLFFVKPDGAKKKPKADAGGKKARCIYI